MTSEPDTFAVPEMERCANVLNALMKRKDASWFKEPVPADTEGYSAVVSTPTMTAAAMRFGRPRTLTVVLAAVGAL